MGEIFRPDLLGILDVSSGILVYFTQSFMPEPISAVHAGILIFKGIGTMIRPVHFPFPLFVIGNMADVLSAAIIFTGTPPVFEAYKTYIAAGLFFKGMWGLFGLMKKF
ncbi:hypothetical protein ACK3SF_02170 [Candidatus Nanosalina sp. VS9-1]|uniref:hypothetical protein n=1 Tax=Candidatus Nanosalina sp. VS9-1 TaxID=3388566 RepID=UPI0039E1AB05